MWRWNQKRKSAGNFFSLDLPNGQAWHIQSQHEGIKYACDQCDYQATTQGNLRVHIQSKHEGIKYACDQCDQQFTKQRSLNTHIQSKHQ